MIKYSFLISLLVLSLTGFSQTGVDSLSQFSFFDKLRSSKTGEGNIEISQDASITMLIEKHYKMSLNDINLSGFRIQIYNSTGKEARDEANEVRNKFMNTFSDVKAYLIYQPPYFKIKVGDFRTKPEAYLLYKKVLEQYPTAYIVQDKINLPPIQ